VASQGQRFRRRALRRGYKVDEVDSFLDRVEATLNGDPIGAPVAAQEVHDVVFRVRFGGYDEWQVDLHLDRVERQLAELEERAPSFGGQLPMRERPAAPPPQRDDRPPGMQGMPQPGYQGYGAPPGPPPAYGAPAGPPPAYGAPAAPPPPPYGQRYDQPAYAPAAYAEPRPAYGNPTPGFQPPPGYDPRYDQEGGGYDGFEPGRHGRADMTTEIHMTDQPPPPAHPMSAPPMGSPVGPGSPIGMSGPIGAQPGMGGAPDAQRIDQLRRTFQPRRFGSGYDIGQVDRLFEGIVQALSGRGSVPVAESELDPAQFSLVPGGYFEAEVDSALKEVRDILRRR
jgi:DivIVA domain-containing protein